MAKIDFASRFPPRQLDGSRLCNFRNHFTKKVKSRPRDHQKWIQRVRFTPRGSEKRAPRQFEQFEQKSKLALGTIKNGFRASDLPPECWKKERKREARQFKQSEQKSKLAFGTIKNGFRASDLPPEGPKKERRGNLSNLSKSQN